jgi:cysteine-rich repeat protein
MLASACFAPDAPPLGTDTLPSGTTDGSTLGTDDTLDGDTGTSGSPTTGPGTSTGDDPATSTGLDGESSDGTPEGCGDGRIGMGEGCDDGNVEAGDGCSDACAEEPGYDCVGAPSTCTTVCGDGIVVGDEACDDDDQDDGDGCTACAVDDGFECTGMPSVCTSPCGDGMVSVSEGCDDGATMNGDGCAADCSVEPYHRCTGGGPGSCAPIRILYAPADGDDAAFRMAIAAITGGTVEYADAGASTPTLMMLEANHDCVFTHPNYTYLDPLSFGNTLAGFVDGGGNVVLGIATDFPPATGLSESLIMTDAYSPVGTSGSVIYDMPTTYAGDGTTPIHDGVVAYDAPIFDAGVVLQGGGLQDGSYEDGTIATAYRPDFKVVYLNGTGNVSFGPTGDWPRLLANACAVGFL